MSEVVERMANAIVVSMFAGAYLLDDLTPESADKARACARAALAELRATPNSVMRAVRAGFADEDDPGKATELWLVGHGNMVDEALREPRPPLLGDLQ